MTDKLTVTLFPRPKPGERVAIVVVDRIADIVGEPEYCVHGRATCVNCGQMCYLGSETMKAAKTPGVFPCCIECANKMIPPEYRTPTKRVSDHLRADGPHDD